MTHRVISIDDGLRLTTVNDLVATPEAVPTRVIDNLRDRFVAETLLFNGGKANTLDFAFEQNSTQYVDEDPEAIAEFAEFPTVAPTSGEIIQGRATKLGYRIVVSREMREYNRVDQVNKAIRKATNRFIRYNDKLLWDALAAAPIPEIAASVAWDKDGSDPKYDIAKAMSHVQGGEVLANAETDYFMADTVVMPSTITPELIANEKWATDYRGNIADQSIRYTGRLEAKPVGLDALSVPTMRKDRVLVLQRGVLGFFKDPRVLEATALKGDGDDLGGNTETFSSRISQIRFVGIDEPFAACWITGVTS
ncbi:hypothetical protein [Corynebacterium aurimucosum]|uniref:phage major capsid protein n=1 Tax=Corynebacterium aurimucosum TaxID=169292 RepID=UPI00187A85A8|nr:hypothetical protein [Corynebacterium aurimucosum]MBE7338119.1 hypothetical protein [Corynebacterium aurimucosum]